MWVLCLRRPEEGINSPRSEVTGGSEPVWVHSLEQPVPLTSEPSPWPLQVSNLAGKSPKFLSKREEAKIEGEDAPQSRGQGTTHRNLFSLSTLWFLGFQLNQAWWQVPHC